MACSSFRGGQVKIGPDLWGLNGQFMRAHAQVFPRSFSDLATAQDIHCLDRKWEVRSHETIVHSHERNRSYPL